MHGEHEDRNEYQVDQVEYKVDDTVGKHVRNVVDVLYNTNQNLSVGTVIVVREGQFLQLAEQIGTDLIDDTLTDLGHDAGTDGVEYDADEDDAHHADQLRPRSEKPHVIHLRCP